jgi:hypothetical protein
MSINNPGIFAECVATANDGDPWVRGRMSRRELSALLEAEAEMLTTGRTTYYGFLLQCQRDVEAAKSTARVWESVYSRLFQ